MDLKLFELFQRYSRDVTQTTPCNQETVALRYMQRAYELGKDAGRAELARDRTDTTYQWYSGDTDDDQTGPEP